jgi:hypothetical protein
MTCGERYGVEEGFKDVKNLFVENDMGVIPFITRGDAKDVCTKKASHVACYMVRTTS